MNHLLFFLKQFHSKQLNEFFRRFIHHIEIPLLKIILKLDGAIHIEPRGSIFNKETFNFLFSDIDFSIVANDDHHAALFDRAKKLKRFFLNLGELEIYTISEWEELVALTHSPLNNYWIKLQLIRKTKWQKDKISHSSTSLDIEKHRRGLEITLARLNARSYKLNANEIFPEIISSKTSDTSLPYYSKYLERSISINQSDDDSLICVNENQAIALLSILPDTDLLPQEKFLKDLKLFIIRREKILAKASLRVRKSLNQNFNPEDYHRWLNDLTAREQLTLKEYT